MGAERAGNVLQRIARQSILHAMYGATGPSMDDVARLNDRPPNGKEELS
jgi:hypothetical protein